MVSERYHQKMFRNNEAFVFLAVIGFVTLGSKVTFSGRSAAFSSLPQRSRFQKPKNFISLMLFLTKLVVLGKSVYQNAFLSFENELNVDLSFSCLGSLT